jgi:hypothetical protein
VLKEDENVRRAALTYGGGHLPLHLPALRVVCEPAAQDQALPEGGHSYQQASRIQASLNLGPSIKDGK